MKLVIVLFAVVVAVSAYPGWSEPVAIASSHPWQSPGWQSPGWQPSAWQPSVWPASAWQPSLVKVAVPVAKVHHHPEVHHVIQVPQPHPIPPLHPQPLNIKIPHTHSVRIPYEHPKIPHPHLIGIEHHVPEPEIKVVKPHHSW